MNYGLYTGAERSYFLGVVAAINALRFYGCWSPVVVFDLGMDSWMVEYLRGFAEVDTLDLRPLARVERYLDWKTQLSPALDPFGFKPFGLIEADRFDSFTYFDADYLPLCNLEAELRPLMEEGNFLACEDGENVWREAHHAALGVPLGRHLNVNSGFFSLHRRQHQGVLTAWRDLMRSRFAYELVPHADQGLLNAVLDKLGVQPTLLDKITWNQTQIHAEMTEAGEVGRDGEVLVHVPTGRRLGGWHATGPGKPWLSLGLDLREEGEEILEEIRRVCPYPVTRIFEEFLFLDEFNDPLPITEVGGVFP